MRFKKFGIRTAVAVSALALLATAACGSSTDTGDTSAAPTSDSAGTSTSESADTSSADSSETAAPETDDASGDDASSDDADSSETAAPEAVTPRDLLPEDYLANGTFVVGTETGYPPYAFLGDDPTTPIGIAPDLMAAVADVLELEIDLQATTYAAYIPGVQNGKYDIAGSGVYDTPERVKEVDMVDFVSDGQAVLVVRDNPLGIDRDNLCGRTVGAPAGSTTISVTLPGISEECGAAGKDAISISSFPSVTEARVALLSGRVDAVGGGTVAFQYMAQQTDGELEVADHFSPQLVGMILQKDSPLTGAVQAAMQELVDNGTYTEILDKWGVGETALECITVNGDAASCIS